METDFFYKDSDQPHPERSRQILAAHPEVRSLFGQNRWTAVILVAVVSLQVALALWMGRLGLGYWWASLLLGWCVGAFANHSLYVVIHDAAHYLIFKSRVFNRLACLVADLPNLVPTAMGFRVFHLKHHAHLGDYDHDADVASQWEARLVGSSFFGKAVWELFFPLFQAARTVRLKGADLWDGWLWANVVCSLSFAAAILFVCGPNGLLYLFASFCFSIGLHPLGARWMQEHHTLDGLQETFSYYGPLNVVALNIGYHNEHHDFPAIPWNRLPRLTAMAPEFYDNLKSYRSWTRLWLQFLFDRNFSLFRRVARGGAESGFAVASSTTQRAPAPARSPAGRDS